MVWGVAVLLVVTAAVLVAASGLARQARDVTHLQAAETAADLREAGRAWAAWRLSRDPSWRGPETVRLAGGEVAAEVRTEGGRRALELRIALRGEPQPRRLRLPLP